MLVFFPLEYIDTEQVYVVREIMKTKKLKRLDDF